MKLLKDLCDKNNIKLTIAVYPRFTQIYHNDLDSIQVKIWNKFSQENTDIFHGIPGSETTLKADVRTHYNVNYESFIGAHTWIMNRCHNFPGFPDFTTSPQHERFSHQRLRNAAVTCPVELLQRSTALLELNGELTCP